MFTLKVCVGFVRITMKIREWPGDEASKPTVVAILEFFSRENFKILVFGKLFKPKSQKHVHAINTDMNRKIYDVLVQFGCYQHRYEWVCGALVQFSCYQYRLK